MKDPSLTRRQTHKEQSSFLPLEIQSYQIHNKKYLLSFWRVWKCSGFIQDSFQRSLCCCQAKKVKNFYRSAEILKKVVCVIENCEICHSFIFIRKNFDLTIFVKLEELALFLAELSKFWLKNVVCKVSENAW